MAQTQSFVAKLNQESTASALLSIVFYDSGQFLILKEIWSMFAVTVQNILLLLWWQWVAKTVNLAPNADISARHWCSEWTNLCSPKTVKRTERSAISTGARHICTAIILSSTGFSVRIVTDRNSAVYGCFLPLRSRFFLDHAFSRPWQVRIVKLR